MTASTGATIELLALDLERHLPLLHAWVTHPRAVYWGMQGASIGDVREEYARIDADPHHDAFLGYVGGEPAVLAEVYDPAHSELADHVRPGDVGMHVLVAPPEGEPRHGFTLAILQAVMWHCFAPAEVRRVVVEPDVRNDKIARLNAAVGFRVAREIPLKGKTAALSFATREAFLLTLAQRNLVAKAIAEFAHERIVTPQPHGDGWFGLGDYRFRARVHPLEHWVVDPLSLPEGVDAQRFVLEHGPVPDALMPTYLEEIASTLAASMWKLEHSTQTADELVHADFQTIESAMTEGHPAFVANNGRIGFGTDDYTSYAPECGQDLELVWVACRRDKTVFSLGRDVDPKSLYDEGEVDPDFVVLPVHPWQWKNKVSVTFAPDVARGDLVHLGTSRDRFRAQQSIRTFFNVSRPERHYVKTALSIQNMGFMRGLSPRYMEATPAINDWVADVVEQDPVLRDLGFGVLRELAAGGYRGDAYHLVERPNAHQKMISALWRESPLPRLAPGERVATMASLLHRDRSGKALVTALIRESGRAPAVWLRSYLRAYVTPIVHCLYRYDLAFMPHGENLILVLEDHVPTRVFMKDIGEEIAVMGDLPLPAAVERVRGSFPDDVKALALHTDVLDGFLRYLGAILADDGVIGSDAFWTLVREAVLDQDPELKESAERYDLLRREFRHSCLNRLQLRNTLSMVDLSDQAESLIFAGSLVNPIA